MKRATNSPARHGAGSRTYVARILDDRRHDPYELRQKLVEPAVCGECGAVYHHGRWCWDAAPPGARRVRCAACQRAHDRLPAGTLTLEGPFVSTHRDEVIAVISRIEANEKAEHPIHRVLAIEQHPDKVVVQTTDVHLPRRIGEALARAHGGRLELRFMEDEYRVVAQWRS